MRLARFSISPKFACTLAFLAIHVVSGFGIAADSRGVAKLPGTHDAARIQSRQAKPPSETHARIVTTYGKLPLRFEANEGQTDPRVKFLSRGRGYGLFLTGEESVLVLRSRHSSVVSRQLPPAGDSKSESRVPSPESGVPTVLRLRLVGANPAAEVTGLSELPGKSNYFIGNDPKKWRTNVANYAKVAYKDVYPGVDLVYYGNQGQLEYDFVVAPGADPDVIRLGIETGQASVVSGQLSVAENGDLVIATDAGEMRFHKPLVYQPTTNDEQLTTSSQQLATDNGQRTTEDRQYFDARYVLRPLNPKSKSENPKYEIAFEIANYDPRLPLIIDPVLSYSTYLGGSQDDGGNGIAVDSSGNAYIAGSTLSADFPTESPLQGTCGGCDVGATDAFVAKLDATGSSLVYATYLGGSSSDQAFAIAVGSWDTVYVTGRTYSNNFPTVNPAQPATGGSADVFVARLGTTGSTLVYSTYLGGSSTEQGLGIAVGPSATVCVVGSTLSKNFPVASPLQATCVSCTGGDPDSFVTKLNAAGSSLVYSTYLGGSGADEARGIAADNDGNAHVTGLTQSNNFPLASALQPTYAGAGDAFVLKMTSSGSALVYSTYLGGTSKDEGRGIALDSFSNAYVTGLTTSSNFPTASAAQSAYRGGQDAFVAKLDSAGAELTYSTYLGGTGADQGSSIAVDPSGQAYVTGYTTSTNLPLANPLQATYGGNQDAFVSKLGATGSALVFSTYLGGHDVDSGIGIALDPAADPYVTGATFSNDFPTASPLQASTGGGYDAFVAKLTELVAPAVALSPTSLVFPDQAVTTTSTPLTITLTNAGDADLTITSIEIKEDFAQTNTCGSSLVAGANCAIDVTFTPTVAGARTGTVTITDDAAGSPRAVPLGGVGIAPVVHLSYTSLNFGAQGVGMTSAPRTVTLTNIGNGPLTITHVAVTVSGDFAETNTCGATVAAGADCDIDVTFTPTALGTREGTLTITDDAVGSPHLVQLGGGGVAAFSLSSPTSSVTVSRGTDSTTFTVSAATQYDFTGSITLSCSGSAPANCAFNPAAIVPGESSTLTISNLNAVSASGLSFAVTGTSDSQTASVSLTVLFPDFNVLVTPPSVTISAGQSASYTLSLSPLNGFNQALTLTCERVPTAAQCSISPSSVTLDGSNTSTATMTVSTVAPTMSGPGSTPNMIPPPLGGPVALRWFILLLAMTALASFWKAQRRARLGLAVVMLVVLAWTACSVGGSEKPPYTPVGNYQLVVTATGGSLTHSASISLSVK